MKAKFLFVTTSLILLAIFFPFKQPLPVRANSSAKTASQAGTITPLATVTVTTTADSGTGSLRAAINAANDTAATTIQFNIPTTDSGFNGRVFIIRPVAPLPTITKDVTIIDGATQTTATGDTNTAGPEIIIDGSLSSTGANGITLNSNSNQIKNVIISNFFGGAGILINGGRNNTVTGCYIGANENGQATAGNQTGIRLTGGANTNTIGGLTANGNVISGNINEGIVITGVGSDANIVSGNFIGVDATSTRNQLPNLGDGLVISSGAKANVIGGATANMANIIAGNLRNGIVIMGNGTMGNLIQGNFIGTIGNGVARGNGQSGITILDGADSNTIGGAQTNLGNMIAFNAGNGISVGAAANATTVLRNRMSRNSIFSNGGLGIDLGSDGVTNNDANDADNGPNTLLNFPVITSAVSNGANATVTGTIDISNPSTVAIEIYTTPLPTPGSDASGFGEGQTFVTSVTPTSGGAFTATFTTGPIVVITALAIDANGNTSEFSSAFQLGGGQPDFTVMNLTATPASINAGGTTRVQFTIRNQGNASASSARHDIVLSTDSTISNTDQVLASVMTSALAPNGTQSFQSDITIAAGGPSGTLFIGVIADGGTAINESSENNNTASVQITVVTMPDLTVRNLTLTPANVNPGDNVRLEFAILNQGSSNAGQHSEDVRLSTDNVIDNNDTLITSLTSGGINAGSSAQFVIDLRIPNNTAPGRYFVGVVADGRAAIAETNETNNIASATINVSGNVDFDLSELNVTPNTGAGGTPITLSVKLNNRGSISAPSITLQVRFSANQTIDNSDTLLGTLTSDALAASASTTLTFTGVIPAGFNPGNNFIGVIADAGNQVQESNENNNTISTTFTIADQSAPKVTVQAPNGNEIIIAGESFTITWTTMDDIGVVTQDIFLSIDSGASFNQVIATGLAGNARSFLWNVPATLSTGTARIQVVARDSSGNLGSDASDNNFSVGLRPLLLAPSFASGKLRFLVTGSNIQPGASLIVVNGAIRESFAISLNNSGTRFIVKKGERSSPSQLKIAQAIPKGVTVQLIVRNSNGVESTPIAFQR
ncbi:MAG: CARDB domain-containing protein [Acidobacteriota bacterium]